MSKAITPITQHEGKKYIRTIRSCIDNETIEVDVYSVLDAFGVQNHAVAHAIKKLLCAGSRGKGTTADDILGAIAALNRALEQVVAVEDEPAPKKKTTIRPGREKPHTKTR